MYSSKLGIYHALPYGLKCLAASLHGSKLRRWRYGPETDRLAAESLERDAWSTERWKAWQQEKLVQLLHRAATRVPFYREHWAARRQRGDAASWEDIRNWPVLEKESIRANPEAFVADDADRSQMHEESTSGTTGTPIKMWFSRRALTEYYALYEARKRRWNGVTRHDRWGIVGGQPVAAPGRKSPPFWVWNSGLNQLYLSAMHVAPWSAESYLNAMRRHRLAFLVTYSSSIYYLACAANSLGLTVPMKVVLTNAEPLYPFQRSPIEQAFGGIVRETYGQAETVCVASECSAGKLHLWPEVGFLEVVDADGQRLPQGGVGRMIATGLMNKDNPLIRYSVGDMGELGPEGTICGCGRNLPILKKVWGRLDDQIITADGRLPVLLDRIFDPPVRVREGQIVQQAIGKFKLRVVPAPGWSEKDEEFLRKALVQLVGEAEVSFEITESIEKTWAGKLRIIVSEMKV